MPIKVTYQNPGLECDEDMVCEDFLNMGMLPLEFMILYPQVGPWPPVGRKPLNMLHIEYDLGHVWLCRCLQTWTRNTSWSDLGSSDSQFRSG